MGALHTGGQGSVYKGKRIGEIITAVKLLPTPVHSEDINDGNYRNFKNEVEKLKKVNEISNPNVVKILSYGVTETGSLPYIEMEFIEGPDLEELLKPPHDPIFTIREVIKVADQLSNALAHCHSVSVKHGDIKSNNVKFCRKTGNYILLDFGLAAMSDEQRRSSMRHAGAIEFMAPEQNAGEVYFQTDVYSFGVILYELLAGTVPFPLSDQGETARNQVMVSHLEVPVPDLLEARRRHLPESWTEEMKHAELQVPDWLLAVVRKCLEKDPARRFSDGMELHDTIARSSALSQGSATSDPISLALLKADNERLRLQLEDQRREIASIKAGGTGNQGKKKAMGFSRRAAVFIVLLLAAGLISAVIIRSGSKSEGELIDTAALNAERRMLLDSVEALNAKRIADSAEAARKIEQAEAEARDAEARFTAEKGRAKEKKKHKFLGIRF